MNRIDEEEDDADIVMVMTVDQFPSVQPPSTCSSSSRSSIYSSKQTSNTNDRSKYQTINRPTSLPPRHSSSSSSAQNADGDVKQRRRYASDSNTNNNKTTPALLVTSFLQHLRNELKATTSDKKNDYHQRTRKKSSEGTNSLLTKSSQSIIMNSKISHETLLENNDRNEILTLIDLLVLRVDCLTNENKLNKKKKKKKKEKDVYPTVAEIDQNLIEYLYYLFTKFINDDSVADSSNDLITPIIDKSNFVDVCQTLVRNGCFDVPSATSDQSFSETTSSCDQTLTQETSVREYHPDTDEVTTEEATINEQDTWLVVDLETNKLEDAIKTSESMCILPISTSDEQLLTTADIYKSCDSESSHSIYLSPHSSLIDLQNMVQEFNEINNHNISLNEDGSLNVIREPKTTISNDLLNDDTQSSSLTSNNICTSLTNDDSFIENCEQMTMNNTDKMSRRERKMHERWSTSTKNDNNNHEQSATNVLLGVEFPAIAVLRRKFSSSTNKKNKIETNSMDKLNSNPSITNEEINTSTTAIIVDKMNPDQIVELQAKDTLALIINHVEKNNDDGQLPVTVSEFICLSNEEITMRKKQGLSLPPVECQTETITNTNNLDDHQETNNVNSSVIITNPLDSNLSSCSSSLISISPTSPTTATNKNKTNEYLPKEEEKEKKEVQRCNDDYSVDEEKKNNSSFVHDYHASGIILINDEPTQTALLQQEKKEKEEGEERERPSSSLPTLEQFNQQRTEDESPIQTLSTNLKQIAMANIDENEQRYKKVEIEEIPDDEEAVLTQNADSIEPIDFIRTDEEPRRPRQSSSQSNITTTSDAPIKFDNVLTCYEKALAKVVDTLDESLPPQPSDLSSEESTTIHQPENDPIALRALQRFEERMNAAAAKTNKDETKLLATKGKSSWSGSASTPRKSLENLFKPNDQQLYSTPISVGNKSTTITSTQLDSYMRPRKTFEDTNHNYGLAFNLSETSSTIDKTNNDDHKPPEEQQQPMAIVEHDDKRVDGNKSTTIVDSKEQQQSIIDTSMTDESGLGNEGENSNSFAFPSTDSSTISNSFNTIMSQSLSTEQQALTPYRLQLEGRRRLNTIDRIRERRQSRDALDTTEQQQQIQNEYTLKPEEVQDPIIRRALQRFDEKNRALTQTKSMNYDEIQDPVTRRALMRLESNLKRTVPTTPNDSNETWFTNSYTLGSLQPTNDRVSRYSESNQSPISNNKSSHVSIHQRYCTPSSPEHSTSTNEHDIPVMRVPSQPIYVTSNNQLQQQQQQPFSLRQRSRSEDMLSSRDLTIGQTTNLDDIDTSSQLQRNRSSNQIALNEPTFTLPNTLIKSLDPNFVRTTESSVSYATPTQTYSAYSCEYTRPRRNPLLSLASETSTTSPLPLPPPIYSQQQQNEIQRPTPYRPTIENQYQTSSSSAFAPVRSSTTTANNYYTQQPLSTSSYGSNYTSNTSNQTPYSDDPIVRRALERFNSQMQNSLMSTSQYQPTTSYLSRQGNFQEPNRSSLMTTSTSSNSGGYQSIIGRRRQTHPDDPNNFFIDNPSIGDGYTSSVFVNSQNPYSMTNHYMNMSDEPPAIPPRFRRDNYRNEDINDPYRRHSTDEYLSENVNNNNNNNNNGSGTLPRDTFIHHAYPARITNATGFRPIDLHYNQQFDLYNQSSQEHEDLLDRAQSTTSTNSSDSFRQRSIQTNNTRTSMNGQQGLPSSSIGLRTNIQQNGRKTNEQMMSNKLSPDDLQTPSGQTTPSTGSIPGDSVFHRLAYTGTKASLSKSSSNSCSNLLNKNGQQQQITTTNLKPCEIDFDDSLNTTMTTENNNEQMSTSTSKYQRSKSVDSRARLKMAQNRANNNQMNIDDDEYNSFIPDEQPRTVLSSKFTSINSRRDAPPPRIPFTPTSTSRTTTTTTTKRSNNGNNLYTKNGNGNRTRGSNGNLITTDNEQQDIENDENISFNDNYQTKLSDNRTRTSIPVHRYTTNNNIQPSPSTSSVNSTISRTKPPLSNPNNLDRRDSNNSITDLNRTSKRSDDNRLISPNGQRRNIPVSVFVPAKLDNKRPAPAPPSFNYESQQQTSYAPRSSATDSSYTTINNETSSTNSGHKTPTRNLMNEFSLTTDKHDTNKKMNVFERLFRGNKKKT